MVIDTGIFIEYLRANNKKNTQLFRIKPGSDIYISSVTVYELYIGATTPEKHHHIRTLIEDIPVLGFDDLVANKAAEIYHTLRKKNKIIEFRDIFIGATALVHQFPVITLNRKHFERIDGLKFV